MRINIFRSILVTAFAFVLLTSFNVHGQHSSSPRHFNEIHVLRSLTLLQSALATYQSTSGSGNFGDLAELREAGLIDAALASGSKYGFVYSIVVTPYSPPNTPARFVIRAVPRLYRKSGLRSFYMDLTGEIRGGDKNGLPANESDPIIPYDSCTLGAASDNQRCTAMDMYWLNGIQQTFLTTVGNGHFGTFAQLHSTGLLRSDFLDFEVRGYIYTIAAAEPLPPSSPARFRITATPRVYPSTGVFSFFIDETGVLRGGDKGGLPANENDPPIGS